MCKDPKEGVDEYISRLKSIPIEEIIEMNGAAHRMYTDGDEPLMDLIDAEEKTINRFEGEGNKSWLCKTESAATLHKPHFCRYRIKPD